MNSLRFVRRINTELRPVLGDDRIVVGAQVLRVPPRWVLSQLSSAAYVASALALVFVYLWARGHWRAGPALAGFCIAEAAAVAVGLTRVFVQRPMLLAVTGRQFICCRLSGPAKHATDVATAPLVKTRITVNRYRQRTTTLRCLMPGSQPLTLNSVRGCQDDLDQVLAVAHSAGLRVISAQDERGADLPGTNRRVPPETRPGNSGRYHALPPADPPYPGHTGRPGERGRAGRPGAESGTDVGTAARLQRRREYPGEHRRSGRGGGEPTRS